MSDGDDKVVVGLFGEATAPPSKKRSKAKPVGADSSVPKVIDTYHDLFKQKFGFKPRISGGKDGKHIKELLATWGEQQVQALVYHFFSTTDPRVMRCDYSIGALFTLAQGLMIDINNGRLDTTSAHILDAVSRAGRKGAGDV